MKIKRIIAVILLIVVALTAFAFVACQKQEEGYKFVAPDGAPALAIACLKDSVSTSDTVYKIKKEIVAASTINEKALRSDLAIVPANMAANIYNKGGDVKIVAVVTKGNLYVLSSLAAQASSLEDLKGRMVYSIGQNSVPDMIFKTLLKDKNIEFAVGDSATDGRVTLKYCANGAEVNAKLLAAKQRGTLAYGLLAEPDVKRGKSEEAGLIEAFDLQQLWAEYSDDDIGGYAQAVLIAKSSVCADGEFMGKLLAALSVGKAEVLNDPSKAEKNIKAIYPQTSLASNLDADVVARCNLDVVDMKEGRAYYEATIKAVMRINEKLIGGKMPDDAFYYAG